MHWLLNTQKAPIVKKDSSESLRSWAPHLDCGATHFTCLRLWTESPLAPGRTQRPQRRLVQGQVGMAVWRRVGSGAIALIPCVHAMRQHEADGYRRCLTMAVAQQCHTVEHPEWTGTPSLYSQLMLLASALTGNRLQPHNDGVAGWQPVHILSTYGSDQSHTGCRNTVPAHI